MKKVFMWFMLIGLFGSSLYASDYLDGESSKIFIVKGYDGNGWKNISDRLPNSNTNTYDTGKDSYYAQVVVLYKQSTGRSFTLKYDGNTKNSKDDSYAGYHAPSDTHYRFKYYSFYTKRNTADIQLESSKVTIIHLAR